jgi:hypothetical protein
MRRRTFDLLASGAGLLIAIVLIVAAALMTWAYTFVNNQVSSQLSSQKIVFPAAGSAELKALPPADAAAMNQYAGQQMTNGAQAQTYANNFIAVHLNEIGGGKTYSQLSAESQANPTNTALAGKVQTLFQGTTLRGLLLNAYAFWKIAQILLIAFIIAYIAGAIMLILSLLGLLHSRRTAPQEELFGGSGRPVRQPS